LNGREFGTALIAAAAAGRLALCQLLLNRGADPNISRNTDVHGLDQVGKTPIHAALKRGHDDVVLLLLQTGNVSVADHLKHGFLLHTAVRSYPESIKLLIDHGADVNKRCNHLGAPLHVAVGSGNITAAATLIQHGARVNVHHGKGRYDSTPIECVHDFSQRDMLRLLIEAGTPSEYLTKALRRLVTANYCPLDSESIQLLIDHGAQVTGGIMWDTKNPKDLGSLPYDLFNMFIVAIYNGTRSKTAYALLLGKVDRQVEGLNALCYSAWRNGLEFVTMLLNLGVMPTHDLISHIEGLGFEQERSEDIAAEMSGAQVDNEERDHRMRSEIVALLEVNV
jgi:ankyrin repeat protein